MSFSSEVKEEMGRQLSPSRHCRLAELAAILHFCGQYGMDTEGQYTLGFQTENETVVRKGFTLLKKAYNIDKDFSTDEELLGDLIGKLGEFDRPVPAELLTKTCCQRAFLRGAFLSVGSISDPEKSYHLEFVCTSEEMALQLQQIMHNFDIEAKIVLRKKYHVVYLKGSEGIVDLLNVCEAHVALMNLENTRIEKEIKNSVNRRVNCEAANIGKTVKAAAKQIDDITYLRDHYGLMNLPEGLREMAVVRLENPDVPLKELGTMLNPPVGKSGVNHRLRKLSELAERIRS